MKIIDHYLTDNDGKRVRFVRSPNCRAGVDARYLIMHFTSGSSAESSISWLCNPASQASAHLVIARDGAIAQLVQFNRVAFHAGVSEWNGTTGLNRYSVGIELDNAGEMTRNADGQWRSSFGRLYADSEVVELHHKGDSAATSGWHRYTSAQLVAAARAARAIVQEYGITEILGHDDIAPKRKRDPGPAFPMSEFRRLVFSNEDVRDDYFVDCQYVIPGAVVTHQTPDMQEAAAVASAPDKSRIYKVNAPALNVRIGPGSNYSTVAGGPLPNGTPVEILQEAPDKPWVHVRVLIPCNGVTNIVGWVSKNFLKR